MLAMEVQTYLMCCKYSVIKGNCHLNSRKMFINVVWNDQQLNPWSNLPFQRPWLQTYTLFSTFKLATLSRRRRVNNRHQQYYPTLITWTPPNYCIYPIESFLHGVYIHMPVLEDELFLWTRTPKHLRDMSS